MKLINYLKSFLYFFIPFITLLLIFTILYYFDIINNNTMKYLKIIIIILSTFMGGFKIGKLSTSKGYSIGIILSLLIIFIFFIISIFTKNIRFNLFIYYLIITITTTLGSMIGINKNHHA